MYSPYFIALFHHADRGSSGKVIFKDPNTTHEIEVILPESLAADLFISCLREAKPHLRATSRVMAGDIRDSVALLTAPSHTVEHRVIEGYSEGGDTPHTNPHERE